MSADPARPPDVGTRLTYELRGLVWGIRSEVEVLTALCARIDDHVRALNRLRAEAAERFSALDELVAAAEDPRLQAWLEQLARAPYPRAVEVFPDRLYAD